MSRNHFPDSSSGSGTGINCTPNGSNITAHDRGHQTCIDLLPTNQANICSLYHCISGLDHCHESTTFDHSKCFRHS
jgi:hypothetical protein